MKQFKFIHFIIFLLCLILINYACKSGGIFDWHAVKMYEGPRLPREQVAKLSEGDFFGGYLPVSVTKIDQNSDMGYVRTYELLPGEHIIYIKGTQERSGSTTKWIEGEWVVTVKMEAGHNYKISYMSAGGNRNSEKGENIIVFIEDTQTKERFLPDDIINN